MNHILKKVYEYIHEKRYGNNMEACPWNNIHYIIQWVLNKKNIEKKQTKNIEKKQTKNIEKNKPKISKKINQKYRKKTNQK